MVCSSLLRSEHAAVSPTPLMHVNSSLQKVFLDHAKLSEMNIGLVLDEGLASPTPTYTVPCFLRVAVLQCGGVFVSPRRCSMASARSGGSMLRRRAPPATAHASSRAPPSRNWCVPDPAADETPTILRSAPVPVSMHAQMRVANHLLEFRSQQLHDLETNCGCGKQLGDVTTVNLTGLEVFPILFITVLLLLLLAWMALYR